MPPQQAYGLLDFVDNIHNLVAHFAAISPSLKVSGRLHPLSKTGPGA
jgi:hypothetical protein